MVLLKSSNIDTSHIEGTLIGKYACIHILMRKTAISINSEILKFSEKGLSQKRRRIQTVVNHKHLRLPKKAGSMLFIILLTFSMSNLLKPAWSSSGNILINATVPPSPNIEVQIGGNISLYFGYVAWSGAQVKLYLSKNGYASISNQTDVIFGPTFDIIKIENVTIDSKTYLGFTVGRNWINGTIPKTLKVAGGECFVKAFDGSSTAVAVTDKSFAILAAFEVAPKYGAGLTPIELIGYALAPNDYGNLSYNAGKGWKTISNFIGAGENGQLTYLMSAPDLAQSLPAGESPEFYSTIIFRLVVNSTGQTLSDAFNEYKRGLRQVYSPDSKNLTVPEGKLFGNNTVFINYGLYVRVKGNLTIKGEWFNPGTIMVYWDDTTLIGTATADENGFFKVSVTVPITSVGNHTITIHDATVKFVLNVLCLSLLDTVPPVAEAGPDQTVNEDTTVFFNGSDSKDDKGIASYVWTFYDAEPKSLYNVNVQYTFSNPGVYHVTLNVTDLGGNWDTDELVVTVLDVTKPIAEAGPNQTVNEDTLVTLNGTKSSDNVGITSYTWTITENIVWTLTGATVEQNFTKPGVFLVTLNVTDAAGNWGIDTLNVTVLDITKPVAEAGPDQTVTESSEVKFYGGLSSDNAGIVAYEWNFGDGTHRSGSIINHTYSQPGNYTVFLTVRDMAGNNATDSVYITVLRDTDRDGIPDINDNDKDGDGMPDSWEIKYGLNPLNSSDAPIDNDGDGLTNLQEYLSNTDPNNFFSPLQIWVIGVTVVPIIIIIVAVYLLGRTTKVSKEEYIKKEVAKIIQQFPDVKELNPGYYVWKVAEIRQEAEKQYDELSKTGYVLVTRTTIRKRFTKALKKEPRKSTQ